MSLKMSKSNCAREWVNHMMSKSNKSTNQGHEQWVNSLVKCGKEFKPRGKSGHLMAVNHAIKSIKESK